MVRRRRVEVAAWTLGVALLSLCLGVRQWSERQRADGVDAFEQMHAAASDAPVMQPAAPSTLDQSLWSMQRVRAFAASLTSPGVPKGVLRIPSLGLDVPVYEGTSELDLNRGAGHIEGTAALSANGNIGIAAHRDGFFRGLKDIAIDDEIHLDVGDRSLRYRVVDIGVVTPSAVHVLADTPTPSITLVTCYPFYFVGTAPQRYIVRAELADAIPAASGI